MIIRSLKSRVKDFEDKIALDPFVITLLFAILINISVKFYFHGRYEIETTITVKIIKAMVTL